MKEEANDHKVQEEAQKPSFPTPLLPQINSPADLRKLAPEQLPQVCKELRDFIVSRLSSNPGHFASSMGAVEIIVALHYVFNTPKDHLVWDVGHQAYAHKILTGRRAEFSTQRTLGGLSGFPNPQESEYDTFIAGHAGNSISAALGMAIADMNTPGQENNKTVAVIGDASIGNGLAFEGLNNASNSPNNLLIILNDNNMSIDANVGALHHYLSEISTSARYNNIRNRLFTFFRDKGIATKSRKERVLRFNNSVKSLISGNQNIFEGLNIRYFGPFDGHDVEKIVRILNEIKDMTGPRILHLKTVKGKGFPEAEANPEAWHAPGLFNPETGEKIKKGGFGTPPNWQDVFGETLVELSGKDDRIMGITAAMLSGTSMIKMQQTYPKRTFDVGISEGHAVTFAGGLATRGKRPFVAIYSSFLQRAFDNIIHDVAIQGLSVTFCIDRAGIVGEDGVTHHGLFDLGYLRVIPGMKIASPSDEETLRNLMYTSLSLEGPMAIRYPRGKAFKADWKSEFNRLEVGKGRILSKRPDARVALLTLGPVASEARKAAMELEEGGILADHYDMIWLKPLDTGLLEEISKNHDLIITVEDGSINGGFGAAVEEWLVMNDYKGRFRKMGVPDNWVHHGKVGELRQICGFDATGIVSCVKENAAG